MTSSDTPQFTEVRNKKFFLRFLLGCIFLVPFYCY